VKVGLFYRLRQFRNALIAAPSEGDLEVIREYLTPEQVALFKRMHPSEQMHSIQVARTIEHPSISGTDEYQKDLKVAALLHDVGKSRYTLRIWERVIIVLGKAVLPKQSEKWGEGKPVGWKRAFVVARKHPQWGAQMALAAGVSPVAAALIERHQEDPSGKSGELVDRLLERLKAADQEH
jgi:putative nucleotidyltransferase with HDIG domain